MSKPERALFESALKILVQTKRVKKYKNKKGQFLYKLVGK